MSNIPNPNKIFPIANNETLINVKPTIKNPNIIVGDFTYFSDRDFESRVTHHYEFIGDRLIIGKFCQIAAGVEFVERKKLLLRWSGAKRNGTLAGG